MPAFIASQRGPSSHPDEVRQVLREKILVRRDGAEPRNDGRGPRGGFVRAAATRTAISLQRGEVHEAQPPDDADPLPVGVDPELDVLRSRHGEAFAAAIRDAIAGLPEQDRTVLRFYACDRLTVEPIGNLYQVNESTLSRWMTRAQETVLERTRALLQERLKRSDTEFERAIPVLQSRLDVSIASLLRE